MSSQPHQRKRQKTNGASDVYITEASSDAQVVQLEAPSSGSNVSQQQLQAAQAVVGVEQNAGDEHYSQTQKRHLNDHPADAGYIHDDQPGLYCHPPQHQMKYQSAQNQQQQQQQDYYQQQQYIAQQQQQQAMQQQQQHQQQRRRVEQVQRTTTATAAPQQQQQNVIKQSTGNVGTNINIQNNNNTSKKTNSNSNNNNINTTQNKTNPVLITNNTQNNAAQQQQQQQQSSTTATNNTNVTTTSTTVSNNNNNTNSNNNNNNNNTNKTPINSAPTTPKGTTKVLNPVYQPIHFRQMLTDAIKDDVKYFDGDIISPYSEDAITISYNTLLQSDLFMQRNQQREWALRQQCFGLYEPANPKSLKEKQQEDEEARQKKIAEEKEKKLKQQQQSNTQNGCPEIKRMWAEKRDGQLQHFVVTPGGHKYSYVPVQEDLPLVRERLIQQRHLDNQELLEKFLPPATAAAVAQQQKNNANSNNSQDLTTHYHINNAGSLQFGPKEEPHEDEIYGNFDNIKHHIPDLHEYLKFPDRLVIEPNHPSISTILIQLKDLYDLEEQFYGKNSKELIYITTANVNSFRPKLMRLLELAFNHFELDINTLQLATVIMDRMINLDFSLNVEHFRQLGQVLPLICLHLSSKFLDPYERALTLQQVQNYFDIYLDPGYHKMLEMRILEYIRFSFHIPLPTNFLSIYQSCGVIFIGERLTYNKNDVVGIEHVEMFNVSCEIFLHIYNSHKSRYYLPSVAAAAIVAVSRLSIGLSPWHEKLNHLLSCDGPGFNECYEELKFQLSTLQTQSPSPAGDVPNLPQQGAVHVANGVYINTNPQQQQRRFGPDE